MSDCIDNINPFQPNNFKITVEKGEYPALNFFAQSVDIPGVSIEAAEQASPRLSAIPHPGDTAVFPELNMNVMCDEDFVAYKEVFDWMMRHLNEAHIPPSERTSNVIPSVSDLYVTALNSKNNRSVQFKFTDAFPVLVGNLNLDATIAATEPVLIPMTFRYVYYDVIV